MNMKETIIKVFWKFLSLLPEGIKTRLELFENKITEVMRR